MTQGDRQIFSQARDADAIVMTKDADFVRLLDELGSPPRVLWLTIGNTSNERVRGVLAENWERISKLFTGGEVLVEVQSRS